VTPTTAELKQTLECAVGRIVSIKRTPCPYSSSYLIDELQLSLADGTELPMIFKNLSPGAVLDTARIRPAGLYDPFREIETYRSVLSQCALGTANLFTALTEPGRYWLFLERVDGPLLWQVGDLEVWRNAARWLSRLHQQPASNPHLLRYDRPYYMQVWNRALALRPDLLPMAPAYMRAVDQLLDLPWALIHGEFYASNILVQGERICPIDWELAACGPGLIDLAALTAGQWDPRERLDFTVAYCGGQPSSDLLRALDCCRLHLAVRLLGWATEWQPPAAHLCDWSREASEIAERLA
jgi:hypothetical protein